jgi:hypothetical protein
VVVDEASRVPGGRCKCRHGHDGGARTEAGAAGMGRGRAGRGRSRRGHGVALWTSTLYAYRVVEIKQSMFQGNWNE